MSALGRCRGCGNVLPGGTLRGLCPVCLLRAGLDGGDAEEGDLGPLGATVTLGPAASDALATLAESLGRLPRVLLRDTEPETAPAPVIQPGSPEMPSAADRSARLQLFGEIARGGMGAVLKGRDTDLGRDLAVKVLLEQHRDHPELVRRFIEEAQITGQLQHPGVVPIYELGAFADRRPYFAMKLVKGRSLADLLRARASSTDDLPRLLGIFEPVTQTVAYAHARGVIHRDLKPSNIMVGSFGEVQVMDWGLAKVLPRGGVADDAAAGQADADETVIATVRSGSDSDRSQAGSVLGTPAYMAPEQARGEVEAVGARADVFALGAMLCEILTGAPAFTGRNTAEIQRRAARGELAEAFARLDGCGADAELVAMARDCLAAEPEDRPRDAGIVAGRITAYLAGVQQRLRAAELDRAAEAARAAEATRRAAVERERRRLTLALAASVVLLIVAGGGGAAWYAQQRQARQAQVDRLLDRAGSALDRPEQDGAATAPARWEEARVALGQAEEVAGRRPGAATASRLRSLQDRMTRADKLRTLLATLEATRGDRGEHWDAKRTDREYAAAFRAFGLDMNAMDPQAAGAALAGRPASVEVAAALDDWAEVRRDLAVAGGKDDSSWRRLMAAARAADPDPWRDNLRAQLGRPRAEVVAALTRLAADIKALERQPAPGLVLLARSLRRVGERDRATAVYRVAWRQSPGDFWVNYELGMLFWPFTAGAPQRGVAAGHVVSTVGPIAGPAVAPKRWEEVARFLTAAVAARPSSFMAHNNLGVALRSKGDLDEAIAEYRAAVRLHPDFYLPHTNLGLALESKGDLDGAIAEFREAIRLKPDHAMAHTNLVDALESKGDLDGAIAEFRARLRLRPDDALTHYSLGKVLRPKGDLDGAIAEFRTAVRLQPDFYWAHNNLAFALIAKGKVDEMVPVLRLAIEKKPGDPNLRHRLAVALLLTNDRAGYRRACAATVQQFGRSTARTLGEAGRSCLISPEALDDLSVPRRLAELAEDRQTRPHWWLYVQGLAHYRACQYEQAVECLTKSMEVGRTWKAVALNWPVLAMAHHRLGHAAEARRYLAKAHDTRGDSARGIKRGEVMSSQADWFDRAEFQFLLREAEELILRSAFPDDPFQP